MLRNLLSPGPRHLALFDAVLALCLMAAVAFAAVDAETPGPTREPVWLSGLIAVVVAGPVAVRRHWPLPSLAVSTAAMVVSLVAGLIPTVAVGAPLTVTAVLVYLVARVEPRRRSLLALAACVLAFAGSVVASRAWEPSYDDWDTVYGLGFGAVVLAAGWAIGFTAQARQSYADQTMAQASRQAVADERLRIARELHDIVAHSMSLIAVKAGVGNHVAETRPEEAREALRVIESTSRSSLAEMRHLLGVLRSEVDGLALYPAPGLSALPELASRAADAGVSVTVSVGEGDLPESVSLSVYRIVQESVTNVIRHAAPTRCQVTITTNEEDVRVEVTNDGPVVRTEPHTGHGLIGMRERVTMYGGTFAAGPRPEGGFQVTATIPYEPA